MVEMEIPNDEAVEVTEGELRVALSDGRSISVPLAWYPRLLYASPAERSNFRPIGRGQGIHWEELDEDISVEGLLAGRPSGESQASLKAWRTRRAMRQLELHQDRSPGRMAQGGRSGMQPHRIVALAAVFVLMAFATRAGPSPVRAQESPFAPIAGTWWSHGLYMEVDDFGIADLTWRTYRWCESETDIDCDRVVNDVIVAGGQARIVFDQMAEDYTAGRVLWVRGGEILRPGPVVLWLNPDGLERTARFAQNDQWVGAVPLCHEPIDPTWYQENNSPCGA